MALHSVQTEGKRMTGKAPGSKKALMTATKLRVQKARQKRLGVRKLSDDELLDNREKALQMVADGLGGALARYNQHQRNFWTEFALLDAALGRKVSRTVTMILREGDSRITTLADLALVTGHELQVKFVRRSDV